MDRTIIYQGQQPRTADLLLAERAAMVGLAKVMADLLGSTGTVCSGLAATPGTGTTVSVAAGEIYSLAQVDATTYGTVSADTTHSVLKQGVMLDASTLSGFAAPGTAGQSINYLIEGKFQENDTTPVVLAYYNSSNPAAPLNGPGNAGTTNYSLRQGQVVLQVKAGTAASTGSQTTPTVDSGFTPLWVVEMRTGDTTPNAGRITKHGSSPFLAGLLNKHHTGALGAAPQIDLLSEVQNKLPMGNLNASDTLGQIAAVQVYAGNPNGHVAGNASGALGTGSPPSQCWDTSSRLLWTCTTTGATSTAVWVSGSQTFSDTGSALAYQLGYVI